jgi:hypothetical protein
MDQGSLVDLQIEAGMRFLREFEKTTPVAVAFWLKGSEDGQWNFYLASDRFDKGKLDVAYREILRITNEMNDRLFRPFQVSLVGLGEPTVQAALEFYKGRPPRIPVRIRGGNFGGIDVEEVYLVKGPTGEKTMATGREVLNQLIDQEAAFFQQNGKPPRKVKLPVLMAYDLAKCGRDELGDLSGRVFKDGITVFEKEGFHGMSVEIVRDRDATLQFE